MAIEFVNKGGLETLISVPRGSRAAAAVAVCLYYLAYNNDVMERLVTGIIQLRISFGKNLTKFRIIGFIFFIPFPYFSFFFNFSFFIKHVFLNFSNEISFFF